MSAQPFVMTHAGGVRTLASYTVPKYTVGFARSAERSAGVTRAVRVWGDGGALPAPLEVTLHVNAPARERFMRLSASGGYGALSTSGATSAWKPTSELDIRVRVRFSTLRNVGQYIVRKQGSYAFYVDTNGRLGLAFDTRYVAPPSMPTLAESLVGIPVWLRVTLETTAFAYLPTFWTSSDGVSWVPLPPTPLSDQPGGNLLSNDNDVTIGESNVMLDVYKMQMRTAIDGAITARFDADEMPLGAAGYYSSTGEYWTVGAGEGTVQDGGFSDVYSAAYAIVAEAEAASRVKTHMGEQSVAGLLGYDMRPIGGDVLLRLRFAPQFERAYFSLALASQSATAEVIPAEGSGEYDVTHDSAPVTFATDTVTFDDSGA